MKVLIVTDQEGVSGIVDWDRDEKWSPANAYNRELMTGEVNAAIEGAFEAGAELVKVAEGHDSIDFRALDERALFVPARSPAVPALQGWEGFDALLMIGHHSMAGTPGGVLAHTGSRQVRVQLLNGRPVGEIGIEIAEAGDFGFPAVLVSGDLAACLEAREMVPGIETAVVKTGYGTNHAECLHPKRARALIREKTIAALGRLGEFRPFVVPGPVTITTEFYEPLTADNHAYYAGNRRVSHLDARTVSITAPTVVEATAWKNNIEFTLARE